jgi:hypothetical protein
MFGLGGRNEEPGADATGAPGRERARGDLGMNPASTTSADLGSLSQSLGFTVEQMVLNRGGAVSPYQLRGFGWLVLRDAVMVLILVGGTFIIAAVVKVWWRWISVAILVALAAFFSVRATGEIRDLHLGI